MNTDVTKQKYLRPAIAVFDMMEDKFLLAASAESTSKCKITKGV